MPSLVTAYVNELQDPRFFLADLDLVRGIGHFSRLSEQILEEATFADNRLPIDWSRTVHVPMAGIGQDILPAPCPAWLWHTSFCGSTLLSRILHVPRVVTSLREPLALRRLADARHSGALSRASMLMPSIALLARPWAPDARVLLKPTHAALNIAIDAMDLTPGARAVVMTSSLPDFLVSHLKKTSETLAKVPDLAGRALSAGQLHRRLAPEALNPPDILSAVALQWAAQRELIHQLHQRMSDRVRIIDWEYAQADLVRTAFFVAGWLDLNIPERTLRANIDLFSGRHAKAPTRDYGPRQRKEEARILSAQHSGEIGKAIAWAERHVLPVLGDGMFVDEPWPL